MNINRRKFFRVCTIGAVAASLPAILRPEKIQGKIIAPLEGLTYTKTHFPNADTVLNGVTIEWKTSNFKKLNNELDSREMAAYHRTMLAEPPTQSKIDIQLEEYYYNLGLEVPVWQRRIIRESLVPYNRYRYTNERIQDQSELESLRNYTLMRSLQGEH